MLKKNIDDVHFFLQCSESICVYIFGHLGCSHCRDHSLSEKLLPTLSGSNIHGVGLADRSVISLTPSLALTRPTSFLQHAPDVLIYIR